MPDRQRHAASGRAHDSDHILARAPLAAALASPDILSRKGWHMPGHLGGKAWPAFYVRRLAAMDTTEMPGTGDINHPEGAVQDAMKLAAERCGAGVTRFLTTGSTTALMVLLALLVGEHGQLIVARTCHQAIVHAAALMNITICPMQQTGWPEPDDQVPDGQRGHPRLSLFPQATAEDVIRAMAHYPQASAVLLTSPDYCGGCADIAGIARVVHDRQGILLVDEAHGAHLPYGRGLLPQSAMAAGADASVQSGHKTLPVLTGGALIHVSAQSLAQGLTTSTDLDRLIPVFQTSSPSFPVAASLDLAGAMMEKDGYRQIEQQLAYAAEFARCLPDQLYCQVSCTVQTGSDRDSPVRDPLRLVVTGRDAATVSYLAEINSSLTARGIDIECADLTRFILIPSLWQPRSDWRQLARAIKDSFADSIIRHQNGIDRVQGRILLDLEDSWRQIVCSQPDQASPGILPARALLGKDRRETVPLRHAAGRITAGTVVPYPPGIPVLWPGERYSQEVIDFLCLMLDNNIKITGIDQENVQVLA